MHLTNKKMVRVEESFNIVRVEVPANPGPEDILDVIDEFTSELYGLVYGDDDE